MLFSCKDRKVPFKIQTGHGILVTRSTCGKFLMLVLFLYVFKTVPALFIFVY